VNRADTLQRRGLYPAPPGASQILGLEAAGEYMQDMLAKNSAENRTFGGFSFLYFLCRYPWRRKMFACTAKNGLCAN
jgi:hypothetical protein